MKPFTLILTLLAVAIVLLLFQKPIAQQLDYHAFADNRTLFGVANFWNVVSNMPFFFIGLIGFYDATQRIRLRQSLGEKILPFILSLGIFATSIGSAYYHYAPDNHTLVWDRLPMTLMFMALFAMVVYDFCSVKQGHFALVLATLTGVFSVWYWQYTESIGQGDLRLYALVQFYPLILLPFVFFLFGKMVNYGHLVRNTALLYILAKATEHLDKQIFQWTNHIWSGHTIKHLLAAAALWYCIKLMKTWRLKSLIS
jgi:hypothetical protein